MIRPRKCVFEDLFNLVRCQDRSISENGIFYDWVSVWAARILDTDRLVSDHWNF
jgi:hypothetical protein